ADECGILHYSSGDSVSIPFVATHPNNYLNWTLSVTRGTHGWVAGTSGNTSSANPDHFVRPVSALIGGCSSGAAFAVNLYCAARAQSGYGRQSQYDSSATSAFALLP